MEQKTCPTCGKNPCVCWKERKTPESPTANMDKWELHKKVDTSSMTMVAGNE